MAPAETTRCSAAATGSHSSIAAGGGRRLLNVAATRDCPWDITTDAYWISIGGNRSGQGDASVQYSVAANPAATARASDVVVGSARVQVSQSAAPCRFSLSRTADSIGPSGGGVDVE